MNELISVIMSTYNEELEWIEKSINSILEQTYKNLEFILVLDNPENHSLKELLKKYEASEKRIKVIINDQNLGLVKSLNIALKHCRGKYIARMDADDISLPDRLSVQKKYLEENNLDFVFSSIEIIDEMDRSLNITNEKENFSSLEVKKKLEQTNISAHPTWLVKREVYQTLDGYREIPYCEDYDFSLRCLMRGVKIGKVNQVLLQYRVRENSITRSYSLEQFLNIRVILKLYRTGQLENMSLVNSLIFKSNKLVTPKRKLNYIKAGKKFEAGVVLLKEKSPSKGVLNIIKSFIISRFYLIKIFDLLNTKLRKENS